jgi:hypothetical protein
MRRSSQRHAGSVTTNLCGALLLTLATTGQVLAEEGRYRAIVLHEGGLSGESGSFSPKVFIVDSRDGHMWTWEQNARTLKQKGKAFFGTAITYQGQLRPGKHMGELIEQSER